MKKQKHTILILGASGFLGKAIYKELCPYYKTFGTYHTSNEQYEKNHHFFQYNFENDDIYNILNQVNPSIIISALRGNFASQFVAHKHLSEYLITNKTKLIFLSSANVFDAYSKYPSYEFDKTLSNSIYGHFKIKIENMLLRLPKKQVVILRLPMVFGSTSPRIQNITNLINSKEAVEVFPNLIINVTTENRVTQQIHYIINRKKYGIFHLGSNDLVHHDEFIKDIVNSLSLQNKAIYKRVYTTNNDRYLAVLPKYNLLPKNLQSLSSEILTELEL